MVNDPAHALAGRPLWAINLGAVVAGTHYRGEFEARMQTLMDEITGEARPIVFIDELHLILGAGRAEGVTMDGANLLKPVLARDEARIIGATTSNEYRLIAKDGALARRFQELHLSAPSGDELHSLLASQARVLALHHGIEIPSELISRAIALADRHLPGREQPDKTLDILDTSAVGARRAGRTVLCLDDLNATLLRLTGLCIGPLNLASRDRLKALQSALNQRVIGQQAVVQTLVATLIHRRLDLRGEERPLGVFLFVGDSGVGKTELARATAECFLGSAARLHRFDLAENAGSEAAVHTLLGAPPGLIGSDQDGSLIRALREPGEQVLLFDEVEKAHLSVQRLLLSLLERGVVHSSHGEALQVRHCLIILTTNAVSSEQLGRLGGIGFGATSMPDPRALLAETFPKEFLGRLDEVLLFRRLDQDDLARILALRLQESLQRLATRGITLDAERSRLLVHLNERLADSGSGARDVTRLIERELLAPIGEALLSASTDASTIELGDDYYRHGRCRVKACTHAALHTTCGISTA
jgi:ATP-dependent Clp protease ATP-binding subunit ClpA